MAPCNQGSTGLAGIFRAWQRKLIAKGSLGQRKATGSMRLGCVGITKAVYMLVVMRSAHFL